MANGNLLFEFNAQSAVPLSSNSPTPDEIVAATGLRPVRDFDSSTDEKLTFQGTMPPHYDGGGMTATIWGAMDTANTGTKVVKIALAVERIADGDALGAAGSDFASPQTVEATVDNTADDIFDGIITFTDGAQMDDLAVDEPCRFELERQNTGLTGTNATGDWQWSRIVIKET